MLTLDVESIEDIALVPEFEQKKLVLRPGTVYPLTIKCTHRGGIEGYLSGQPNLSSYKVVLTDKEGQSTSKIPETDGSFIFENMAYGKYTLQVVNHEGAVIYNKSVNLQDAYYILAEAIKL